MNLKKFTGGPVLAAVPLAITQIGRIPSQGAENGRTERAKQTREDRDQMVESIRQRRMKIMRAIDAAFPHTLGSSTQARAEFLLPRNRPYSY